METNLLDRMLNTYLANQTSVTITLQNKIRVTGRVRAFDSYIIIIEGQKREILYRHAMSSLCPAGQEETRTTAATPRPAAAKPASRVEKTVQHKPVPKPHPQPQVSAPAADTSLNNSMKEGLLKWMQGQKAAK